MSTPGEFITPENEEKRERKLHLAIYFHADDDPELRARIAEIVYAVESGLGESDDPKVREYTYVEAIVTNTENP
jgi:hypothetical protein